MIQEVFHMVKLNQVRDDHIPGRYFEILFDYILPVEKAKWYRSYLERRNRGTTQMII